MIRVATGMVDLGDADLLGATYAADARTLDDLGLTPARAERPSSTGVGTVVAVDPSGRVRVGSPVTLTVATAMHAGHHPPRHEAPRRSARSTTRSRSTTRNRSTPRSRNRPGTRRGTRRSTDPYPALWRSSLSGTAGHPTKGAAWSLRSIRPARGSCSPRTAACRCTSAACSSSRSPRVPAATTAAQMYESMRDVEEIAPLFLKRPHRSLSHGRPAGLGRGRAVRHRAPRPAQRAAQARPDPRAARPQQPAAQHPARLGAAAVGGAHHRGPARRPGRALHEGPPRPGRRHLRDAAAAERALHRPRPARDAAAVGRPHPAPPGAARRATSATGRPRRDPHPGDALGARDRLGGRRHARRADQDDLSKGVRNETSAISLYAPRTIFNQKITGSRRFAAQDWPIERLQAHRQGHRHDDQRRGAGDVRRRRTPLPARARRAPGHAAGRDGAGRAQGQGVAHRLGRGRQRRRRGDVPARHRPRRPGRPADRDPRRRCRTARRRCRA